MEWKKYGGSEERQSHKDRKKRNNMLMFRYLGTTLIDKFFFHEKLRAD
jgi:hypothetical protein